LLSFEAGGGETPTYVPMWVRSPATDKNNFLSLDYIITKEKVAPPFVDFYIEKVW